MAVKLHRCSVMWFRGPHPCWKVQKALDDAGVEYEIVKYPPLPRSRRTEVEAKSGQRALPTIEFEDGTMLREDSKDLAARIRAGRLTSPSVGA
jgi:glutaredoxin